MSFWNRIKRIDKTTDLIYNHKRRAWYFVSYKGEKVRQSYFGYKTKKEAMAEYNKGKVVFK